jgi:hypothetical protein
MLSVFPEKEQDKRFAGFFVIARRDRQLEAGSGSMGQTSCLKNQATGTFSAFAIAAAS